jgi:hypothetical protein
MQCQQITKILINSFATEGNDEKNIKRRIYDAINVMVAADLFHKSGEYIEKVVSEDYFVQVKSLKS